MPSRMTAENSRFFTGIFPPNRGVSSTPATMVICQVAAVTAGRGIRLGPFAFSRLLHGFLTAALSLPVLRGAGAEAVLAPSVRPVPVCDGFTLAGTLCLLAMCAILFAALPAPKTKIVTKSFERNR